jgi:hypothetical protein
MLCVVGSSPGLRKFLSWLVRRSNQCYGLDSVAEWTERERRRRERQASVCSRVCTRAYGAFVAQVEEELAPLLQEPIAWVC